MKHSKVGLAVLLGLAFLSTGCFQKKSTEQASTTGFEAVPSTEELAQLPQTTTSSNQQGAIEVLPIENAPVTPSAAIALPMTAGASELLSYNQKIQTALKNAGLYEGAIDGKIGPATRKAVQTFQKEHGLKVDGKVGPKTWAALEPYLSGTAGTTSGSATATATD